MGLLDVLNGMQQGPRGPCNPSAQSSGGMSPMTMAILGLLAWKAIKHITAGQPGAAAPQPAPSPAGGGMSGMSGVGGGLGNVLKGAARRPARGRCRGQRDLRRPRRCAQAVAAERPRRHRQFVGRQRRNKAISPGDLANALGADQIGELASQSGLSRERIAQWPQPVSARGDRSSDTGWTAADRKRGFRAALTAWPAKSQGLSNIWAF